jgi:hypothetical protein
MSTVQIDILDPRANKLLQELESRHLIAIRSAANNGFLKIVQMLRSKAKKNLPSLAVISGEVESVRAKHYARKKR